MKKIMFMLLGILIACSLWAETIVITETCQIRDTENYKTSKQIGVAIKDEEFQTLGKFGDYYYVSVIDSKSLKVYNGWAWQGYMEINFDDNTFRVTGQGGRLVKEPKKESETIVCINAGSVGEIIKEKITWYKIYRQGIIGWVSTICCKIK